MRKKLRNFTLEDNESKKTKRKERERETRITRMKEDREKHSKKYELKPEEKKSKTCTRTI